MAAQNNIREVLSGHTLIPVVTFSDEDNPVAFMHHLMEQNVRCIEVTLRTTAGMKAIKTLKAEFGSKALIGAGTVLRSEQVSELAQANADFLVSPGLTQNLMTAIQVSGLPYLPGIATPGECMHAMEMGLDTLKFFPANLYGGKSALKAFGQLFPTVKFCPTGGITSETSAEYLALGNVIAVGGSWFQKDFKS